MTFRHQPPCVLPVCGSVPIRQPKRRKEGSSSLLISDLYLENSKITITMDVHCSSCREPWGVYHLRNEAIFETGLPIEKAKAWILLPRSEKLSQYYREAFRSLGLEFGNSVLHVRRCPCCPKNALPDPEVDLKKFAIVESLVDEDSIALAFEASRL